MSAVNQAEIIFGSVRAGQYPGAFPPQVEKIITKLIGADRPVLHLFSGGSEIGDVRVDINPNSNATHKVDAFEFLKSAESRRPWKWVIGDPDYCDEQAKRMGRPGGFSSQQFAGNVEKENIISDFMAKWTDNILWLDRRMPRFNKVFARKKVWLIRTWGWHNVRVLQWLSRVARPLEVFA